MNFYKLNLHLFEGEGAAAAAGEGAGAEQGQADQAKVPASRRGKSGALSNVLYGSQADAAGEPQAAAEDVPEVKVTSTAQDERRQAFRNLITGEYKDLYGEEVQRLIDRRFAETKNLQQQVDSAQPILDKLAARYNILDGDMSKLAKAIDDDHSYWATAAEEAGMSEETFREFQQMRQQNAALQRMQQEQRTRQQANEQAQRWYQESLGLKAKYPNFDLNTEWKNPKFVEMLQHFVPMEQAYQMLHFDELMQSAVRQATNTTQQAVVENIRTKGARPAENGSSSQSTFTVKRSAGQLNRADRSEIARRVRNGEQISF